MSPYPSTLQLSPSVCLHLLCLLLLLTESASSTVPKKEPVSLLASTQANCSTACDNGGVSENATDLQMKKQSEGRQVEQLSINLSASVNHTLDGSVVSSTPLNQSLGGHHPSNQQPVLPDFQRPSAETVGQPAALLPSTTTQAAHNGASTAATSSTAEPVKIVYTTTLLVAFTSTTTTTPPPTMTPPPTTPPTTPPPMTKPPTTTPTTTRRPTPSSTAAAHPATTVKATTTLVNTTVTMTTTTGTKMPPPPPPSAATQQPNALSTVLPPVQTSLPRGPTTITVGSTSTPGHRNEPGAAGTRVAMVDVAGAALTQQLMNTASLLSVLLFGLLFFLATVAVFVTQAYESYRRKDYTQVDYLINGMYTDSGV